MKRHGKSHPHAARLFAEPARPTDAYIANVDGASRNNPGPASYGVVLRRPDGSVIETLSKYIGIKTNNEAEYFGLIAALDLARAHRIAKLRIRSDSELLVRQMQGAYKVKSPKLKHFHEQARRLAGQFAFVAYEHVPRAENAEADKLANKALDDQLPLRKAAPPLRAASGAASANLKAGATKPLRARANYVNGVLVPDEPLPLAEGEAVELTIRKKN